MVAGFGCNEVGLSEGSVCESDDFLSFYLHVRSAELNVVGKFALGCEPACCFG